MNYHCEIHRQKTLGIVCTYASCPKKGIICVLCQHEDHLDHSHYCLPLEILIEKCEKLKTNNKDAIKEIKKKLKLINDGSKLLLKEFVKKVTDVCASISKEIDANAEREIELLEDIIRRDERMVQDFKKFDECLDNYKMNIRPHMQNIIVDINVEKVEKIRFTCHSSDSCFRELHDLERKTKEFEEYLRDSFHEAENCLNDLFIVKNGKESGRSSPSLPKSTQEFLPIRCDIMNQSDVFSKNGQMKEEETKSSKEERNGKEVIAEIMEKSMSNCQSNKESLKITQPSLPLNQSINQEIIGNSNEQNGKQKSFFPQKNSNEQNENGNQKLFSQQNGQGLFSKKGNEQIHFPKLELNEKKEEKLINEANKVSCSPSIFNNVSSQSLFGNNKSFANQNNHQNPFATEKKEEKKQTFTTNLVIQNVINERKEEGIFNKSATTNNLFHNSGFLEKEKNAVSEISSNKLESF